MHSDTSRARLYAANVCSAISPHASAKLRRDNASQLMDHRGLNVARIYAEQTLMDAPQTRSDRICHRRHSVYRQLLF